MSGKTKVDKIVKAIKSAMDDNECNAYEIKQNDVLSSDETLTEWDIRSCGGLNAIKNKYFPVTGKELAVIHKIKKDNSYVSKLEAKLGEKEYLEAEMIRIIDERLKPLPKINVNKKFKKNKKTKLVRHVVAMLNDLHVGLIIDGDEMGGLNNFDFKEAGRRIAFYVKEVADYKPHVRNDVEKLHLILNGDVIAGIIHGLETKGIHLLVHQLNGLTHILTHAISYLIKYFPVMEVYGIPGNHCRMVHKNHGKRPTSEVYDSYANVVYYSLSTAFRNNKNIKFNFPKTPYISVDLPAGRAGVFHGDHIFSSALGNPGKTINVKTLSSAIKDFNSGEVAKGLKPLKLLMFAHTHSYAHFITNDGVEVYCAPSLCGSDMFAHSININHTFAAQVVLESTPEYILGDSRLIRVAKADYMPDMDDIIPIFNKELSWQK